MFKAITVENLLSFGPDAVPLELENLNVLIGPNGSGKSNLLESIALLRSSTHKNSTQGMRSLIAKGGGIKEWIWKGHAEKPANIECLVEYPTGKQSLRHSLHIKKEGFAFSIANERIENEHAYGDYSEPYLYYDYQGGHPVVNLVESPKRRLKPETVDPQLSILAQLQDAESYPEITYLGRAYDQIRLYREWEFGRNAVFREAQRADVLSERLEEDFSNLGLFLNRIRENSDARNTLLNSIRDLYEGLTDFHVSISEGGNVQVVFFEGQFSIPATRLSDGSMRYLCLLAILCDPTPPPLVAIEEPELGLHPDILPKLGRLLLQASQRTQLIVTTHSDILVDALSDHPQTIVVCEKHDGITRMRRLDSEQLAPWLEKYRLGDLWTSGEIGGTRW